MDPKYKRICNLDTLHSVCLVGGLVTMVSSAVKLWDQLSNDTMPTPQVLYAALLLGVGICFWRAAWYFGRMFDEANMQDLRSLRRKVEKYVRRHDD